MTIRELVTIFGFDIDMAPIENLDKRIGILKGQLKDVGLQGGAAAAAMFGIAKITANLGEESLNASKLFKMSVEDFQEYSRAMDVADVSQEDFTTGLRFMLNAAGEAKKGNKQMTESFARIGVDALDANKNIKPTIQLFNEVSDGLSGIKDEQMRVNVAQDILGRGAGRLVHVLSGGSAEFAKLRARVRDTGVVMGTEAAEAANKFNDELDFLKFTAYGLRNMIGVGLFPVLTDLFISLQDWYKANRELIKQNVSGFVKGFIGGVKMLAPIILGVVGAVVGLVKILGGAEIVTRTFIQLWLLWNGFAIAKSILGIGQAIYMAASAMGVFRASTIPVVAAIAVLILMVLDFFDFLSGDKDTVFGRLWNDLKSIFTSLQDIHRLILDIMKSMGFEKWVTADNNLKRGGLMPGEVRVLPGPGRSGNSYNQGPTTITAPITISIPGSQDPAATGQAVSSFVGERMETLLRTTWNANKPMLER